MNNNINCIHDDSGGHPDYHCDQHDNTPSRMVKRPISPIIKNVILMFQIVLKSLIWFWIKSQMYVPIILV